MKKLLTLILIFISANVFGQSLIPFGGQTGSDTAYTKNSMRVDNFIRFVSYNTKDTTLALGFTQNGTAVLRSFLSSNVLNYVDVTTYGAVGDGVTDNSPAIDSAIAHAAPTGKYLYFPKNGINIWNISHEIAYNKIKGQGSDITVINASGGNISGFPDQAVVLAGRGTQTFLSTIGRKFNKNDTSIKFSSSQTLNRGDLIELLDTNYGSFSPFDDSYMEGQFSILRDSGTGMLFTIDRKILANYRDTANALLYKINLAHTDIEGISIIGFNVPGNTLRALEAQYSTGTITDVKVNGCDYAGILIADCYDLPQYRIKSGKFDVDQTGTSYGMMISNSEHCSSFDCDLFGFKDAIAHGGSASPYGVPTRYCDVIGGTFKSSNSSSGKASIDYHGNCADAKVMGVVAQNGINYPGNNIDLINNTIYGSYVIGDIFLNAVKDATTLISGNKVYLTDSVLSGAQTTWIDFGYDNNIDTNSSNTFDVTGNYFALNTKGTLPATISGLSIYNNGKTSGVVNVNVCNNTFTSNNHTQDIYVHFNGITDSMDNVIFKNNNLQNVGLLSEVSRSTTVTNNLFDTTYSFAIEVENGNKAVVIGNIYHNYGFYTSGAAARYFEGMNTMFINNESGYSSSSLLNWSTVYSDAGSVYIGLQRFQDGKNDNISGSSVLIPYDNPGGLKFEVGSDATGDIYYRNSGGIISRLGIGSSAQVLGSTGTIPAWVSSVTSVSNSEGSLTISPTSGSVISSINPSHTNSWTVQQNFVDMFASGNSSLETIHSFGIYDLNSASDGNLDLTTNHGIVAVKTATDWQAGFQVVGTKTTGNIFNVVNGTDTIMQNDAATGNVILSHTISLPNVVTSTNNTDNFAVFHNGKVLEAQRQITYSGTATLASGTVTVSDSRITTGTRIAPYYDTPSGTTGSLSAATSSIVNNTSFIIKSTLTVAGAPVLNTLDNSTVNYSFTISY